MTQSSPGKLIVLSGPSGVGKSTVLDALLSRFAGKLRMAVSATTRSPRPGEIDGDDYYFLTPETFEIRRKQGDFLECCEVFGRGYWYGTLIDEVSPRLKRGEWVILEIDVEGTKQILEKHPEAETIFLRPESIEVLEQRLRDRATETEEAIARRLSVAKNELASADMYKHQVVNDQVEKAVETIATILTNQGLVLEDS